MPERTPVSVFTYVSKMFFRCVEVKRTSRMRAAKSCSSKAASSTAYARQAFRGFSPAPITLPIRRSPVRTPGSRKLTEYSAVRLEVVRTARSAAAESKTPP